MAPFKIQKPLVVLVDDEPNLVYVLEAILRNEGLEVVSFTDSQQALQFLKISKSPPQLILSDVLMPELDGLQLLHAAHAIFPQVPFILLTAHGTIELAVKALKNGASDFITKPFEQAELLAAVKRGVDSAPPAFRERHEALSCTKSAEGQKTYSLMKKISHTSAVPLFYGEAGTGKEVLARELHQMGPHAAKRFVKMNCATFSSSSLEAELFGCERGAFFAPYGIQNGQGTLEGRPGKMELAADGTLFLEEVTQLPLPLQHKLIRAVEEKEFTRVGGIQPIPMTARIITATRDDLDSRVEKHDQKNELFFKLNIFPIKVSALRERKEEIPYLIQEFLIKFSNENQDIWKFPLTIEKHCEDLLVHYAWPGNIRELENTLQRMALLCQTGVLTQDLLPREFFPSQPSGATGKTKEGFIPFKDKIRYQTQTLEKEYIVSALRECDGNISQTATRLGLSRKGLQLKMRELGLKRPFDNSPGSP